MWVAECRSSIIVGFLDVPYPCFVAYSDTHVK